MADKYLVNIKLPEGYILESMPKSSKITYNEKEGEFTYLGSQNGNYLQLIISFELKQSFILPNDYESFKEFYQGMIEKQTEMIVLKKV